MRLTSPLFLGCLSQLASAFPAAYLEEALKNDPKFVERTVELLSQRQEGADGATAIFESNPTFDAEAQFVDVSEGSGHEFVPPGPNDLRGPCPGLNAFANHGFLPHNGYATIQQYIDATTEVVGMGPFLAGFLSILGGVQSGDGVSWSIGGTPPRGVGGPLASVGNGLSGSHNKYETDASPTRPDLYEEGNTFKVMIDQFQQLIDFSPGGVVDLNTLTAFRSQRFDDQVASNPFFFNGPFSGVAVQPAAYTFIFRFMANHTEEDPTGLLSYETLQSWFGVAGTPGDYSVLPGQERIPDNWYRRSQDTPYEVTYFIADLLNAGRLHPKFLAIGGNLGEVNSFAGINLEDLTGGLFNSAGLLQGNNLACFLFQVAQQADFDLVTGLLGPLTRLTAAIGNIIGGLSCPQLRRIDQSQLEQFPGFNR